MIPTRVLTFQLLDRIRRSKRQGWDRSFPATAPPPPKNGSGGRYLTHRVSRLKANNQLDFTDPAAVKQLTKSLLSIDFGLKVELPDDRLCPPVSAVAPPRCLCVRELS